MTDRRATLSVVVPTLDEEAYLPALLASLAASGDDAPDEVVVADGGSRDRTVELAEDAGARVVPAHPGRGSQLARGARASTGDLLLFLHADARVAPAALGAVRRALREGGPVAAGLRQRIERDGLVYRCIERAANARVRRGWVYGDSGLALSRAHYVRVGGFRDLALFEDLDLSRRLRRQGAVRLLAGAEVRVSPRRWEREGALRRTLANWLLTAAWRAGVDPARLVRYYRPRGGAPGPT